MEEPASTSTHPASVQLASLEIIVKVIITAILLTRYKPKSLADLGGARPARAPPPPPPFAWHPSF